MSPCIQKSVTAEERVCSDIYSLLMVIIHLLNCLNSGCASVSWKTPGTEVPVVIHSQRSIDYPIYTRNNKQ